VDNVLTTNLGIDGREGAQRFYARFGKEPQQTERHPETLLERIGILGPQGQHRAHIDFIEGREDRRCMLCLHESFSDAPANTTHRLVTLTRLGPSRCRGTASAW